MILSVEHLSFGYGKNSVLKDISFSFCTGELVFLLGANGSGKSTLLKLLAGLYVPESGKIILDGEDVFGMPSRKRAVKIGLMPQNGIPPFDYSAEEFVLFGRTARLPRFSVPGKADWSAVHRALEQVRLEKFARKSVDSFSGGEFQRLRLASVLALESDILLLDEPFSAQDPAQVDGIVKLLQELSSQKIILISTHQLATVQKMNTRAILMVDHKILADGIPNEILTQEKLSQTYCF